LNSITVAKSETFIASFDELYENLDEITPYAGSSSLALLKSKSMNDMKMRKILSKTIDYSSLFVAEKLNDILIGKAVYIASTPNIELKLKIYPRLNLKRNQLNDFNQEVQWLRFGISKDSSKFDKLYEM
jgi:hypothetical protein